MDTDYQIFDYNMTNKPSLLLVYQGLHEVRKYVHFKLLKIQTLLFISFF